MNNKIINLSVVTQKCACCEADMLMSLPPRLFEGVESQELQLANQGVVLESNSYTPDDGRVCANCNNLDKIKYLCNICGQHKSYSQIERNMGNRYFCSECYGKVSAKDWDRIVYLQD